MADIMTNTVMFGIIGALVLMLFLVIIYYMLTGKKKTVEEEKIEVIEEDPREQEQTRTIYTYGEE